MQITAPSARPEGDPPHDRRVPRMDNVTVLRKSDAEVAADIKAGAGAMLAPICALMDEARADGLVLNFQIGVDGFGRSRVVDISVVKPL